MRRRQRHLLFCLSPDSGRKPRGPPCLLPAANMGPNPFAKSTSHHLGFNISAPRMPVSIANTITGAELMFSGNRLKPETDTCLNILRGVVVHPRGDGSLRKHHTHHVIEAMPRISLGYGHSSTSPFWSTQWSTRTMSHRSCSLSVEYEFPLSIGIGDGLGVFIPTYE
jgi:hypothetical protein